MKAAIDVFLKDCLIHLGTCVAPAGTAKPGKDMLTYTIDLPSGRVTGTLKMGELKLFPLPVGEKANAELEPARGFDVGLGKGVKNSCTLNGGVVGIVLDGRGRPFILPATQAERVAKLKEWMIELNVYPESAFQR